MKLAEMDGASLSIAQIYRKVEGEEKGLVDALEQGIFL